MAIRIDDEGQSMPARFELPCPRTEHYAATVRDAFLVHAAFLVRNNKTILISGAPGAGKTTLCVALSRSGYDYQGDDIVRLEGNGRAMGTPFAACVKAPAWSLVAAYAPEIHELPVYHRADDKNVRYLPVPPVRRRPRSVDFVLLLSRQPDAKPAFEPVEPLDAFSTLLESSFSAKGSISVSAPGLDGLTARSPPTCGIAAILAGASRVLSLRLVRLPADLPLCGARERRRLPERLDEAL